MDTVTILRDLWRRRLLVACAAAVGMIAGFAVLYSLPSLESRRYEVGVATASILVDTPNSQVVDVVARGSDTLGVRANLLASLMVDGVVKEQIARRAGIDPDELISTSVSTGEEMPASSRDRHAPRLATSVVRDDSNQELPIISIEVQERDRAAAAVLADAALLGLRDSLDTTAAEQRIPGARRLRVTGLGAPQARTATKGPKVAVAVAVAFIVFGLGCAALLATSALVRAWRAAAAAEDAGAESTRSPEPTLVAAWPLESGTAEGGARSRVSSRG